MKVTQVKKSETTKWTIMAITKNTKVAVNDDDYYVVEDLRLGKDYQRNYEDNTLRMISKKY